MAQTPRVLLKLLPSFQPEKHLQRKILRAYRNLFQLPHAPQVQKLVNNWLVVTSFSIGVADTVADTETIMTIGGIIDTAKR